MKSRLKTILSLLLVVFTSCKKDINNSRLSFSGIYPHLAYYNEEGECGTGAVVPWADRLWVVTYGPHLPDGSSDKLYAVTSHLEMTARPESTGGTPANRLIHRESNQLFIGPYVIDGSGNVRVIPYETAPGRYTGAARHLTDPANKVYIATMEEGFYEVDVHTLEVKELYKDGNRRHSNEGKAGEKESNRKEVGVNTPKAMLPGAHGKGLYSGQGALYYANNGEATREALHQFNVESGALSEWDGNSWSLVRRNQFTEITGPGGIYGNTHPDTDPLWAVGWDHKSVLLALKDNGAWSFFRLPKACYSYDGAHGWNTEWPRIRNIGTEEKPDYLMTMHGMFWRFPATFSSSNTAGIRPRSSYLKVIGDFTRWNNQLVFGCDDSAQKEFLNKRKVKGNLQGAGQSNSNLWFTDINTPDNLGTTTSSGYVWLNESVKPNQASEPFLFAGWEHRACWIKNAGNHLVTFILEVDKSGINRWEALRTVHLPAQSSVFVTFNDSEKGEWIRARVNKTAKVTVAFNYSTKDKIRTDNTLFNGLASISENKATGGLLYALGNNRRALGLLANSASGETGYYELDQDMNLVAKNDRETADFIRSRFAIPRQTVEIDSSSVLIVDDKNRRWRLPLGNRRYTHPTLEGKLRICREAVTERDLFNCHGTFYELPAENADGFAKIRPVSSHSLKINDYASYRGLLILTGITPEKGTGNPHIIVSGDKKASVWAGTIDDLWKLGKPAGKGGPWKNAKVEQDAVSDPYLIGFYDKKTLVLSHQSQQAVTFAVEADPTGDGCWMQYEKFTVKPHETLTHKFPEAFHARWIRFSVDKPAIVTAWLEYN
ncbi:MAG: hypothetical protein LBS03_02475 [Bacteroidales bacterium]|nr:hypothetical protein [Bacteroidales bacterium]